VGRDEVSGVRPHETVSGVSGTGVGTVHQDDRAADVLLVIEIVSPGSRRTDHVTKLREYAKAGIPTYWIVDTTAAPGEQFLAFTRDGNAYRRLEVQVGERIRVIEPVPMEFLVRDLTR
jgi:Uma2 family endonuclease